MKILTVIYDLDKGGTQKAAQIFAETYKKTGHDSRILSLYNLGFRYEEMKNHIEIWYKISDKNLEEIKEWNPDIVHIHSHGPKEIDINKLIVFLQNDHIKIIETNVFSKPSPWADKIDISFQLSNWALWLYYMRGGNKFKTAIVPYPIDCSKFNRENTLEIKNFKKKYGIPEDSFVIGRVGQSFNGKWSAVLIDSFNNLAKKHKSMYMVVVNPPDGILSNIIKSKYKDRIIHIPKIYGDKNLSVAYSSFNLMIHAAEQGESFGYVLGESILCGTPVVTLSTPWGDNSQCEVVGNLKGGYVVNDTKGIIEAVEHYIKNPRMHEEIIKTGFEHIHNNYNSIKIANEAIKISQTEINTNDLKSIQSIVISIVKNTFDKTHFIVPLLIKSNILFLRRITLYRYPMHILIPTLIHKFINKITR